ncbi:HBL355Cp [Eremothecium sinecaudum]|uniref:Cation-transporting ATPase n=1 Tax=Eremothecium sinecaudum TaxID=45286 RepID=A0A109UWP6_9SACH|nr:HBL355Cp [Eremothecium sinecaudum]AMD18547.1 HBL355Cp [Eremothecium sinecaudum]
MTPDRRNSDTYNIPNPGSRRSFSSSNTLASSNTITSSTVGGRQNNEAYAGVTFEAVPTSIVSFHHPHSYRSTGFGSGESFVRSRRDTGTDSLLLTPVHSRASQRSRASSRAPNFRFFTGEQVENAEGAASTLEYADYDTDWEALPAYEQERLNFRNKSPRSSLRNTSELLLPAISSNRALSLQSYGAVDNLRTRNTFGNSSRSSISSSQYSIRDRIPVELEEVGSVPLHDDNSSAEDNAINSDLEETVEMHQHHDDHPDPPNSTYKKSYHSEFLKPQYHDRFYPQHLPRIHFQRFYIAEEDLVIAIAGYKTNIWKLYLYYVLCCLSFGILFLICKWVPRYKVRLRGSKTALGKAEWVVVENEYSELSIINVKREWYNRPLSTILSLKRDNISNNRRHYHHESEVNPNVPILISFEYRYYNLIYSPLGDVFQTNCNWADPNWVDVDRFCKGLPTAIQEDRLIAFGKNSINLKQKTTSEILFDEALHPFYIFQIFSVILWMFDHYYYYAGCIFLISILSILDNIFETKQSYKRLSEVSQFHCDVRVYKDGFWTQIPSTDLVPGDIYEISDPSLSVFPCDSVLISGDCLVNESMLNGESVPVPKTPATQETMIHLLDDFMDAHISAFVAKSFLFNGTKIIRVRSAPGQSVGLAMVVRTGFSTTKGALVRSMAFPKPVGFKFYEDSFKYIGYIAIIAVIGFALSCIQFVRLGVDTRTMVLRALDIITIVIPPALPASLTIGTGFALNRLKKKGIFCISPTRVNVGGKLDVMCFDKTGTLTEDGLDVFGVHAIVPENQEIKFGSLISDVNNLFPKFSLDDCSSPADFKARNFLLALLTCHSLRLVDGELLGDPLDFKMFSFTNWAYEEDYQTHAFHSLNEERHDSNTLPENTSISPAVVHPSGNENFAANDPNNIIGIIRSFEFLPHLRRMTVITKSSGKNVFMSFTKGAPEVIAELCNRSSLPADFDQLLQTYTHSGYRVIACAGKTLPKSSWLYSQKVSREDVESNLEFLGFIIFENKLKNSTKSTLTALHSANIRTIMCTGDNILTAISVGLESGLVNSARIFIPILNENALPGENIVKWQNVDNPSELLDSVTLVPQDNNASSYSLAMTGDVFRMIFKHEGSVSSDYINRILLKCAIYARMAPDEKNELVEQLQALDYQVGFCGDGANDCGALRAADVGISLSEAEASVAAPFTSHVFEISCVLDVIKEGRAALVTSFSCFQYMSLYSAIQFITITILYSRGTNLTDLQFLYIDLFLIVPIAVFMSWSKPYEVLVSKRPSANLVSPKILLPLIVHILVLMTFQFVPWIIVQYMSWYVKPIVGNDESVRSSDNTVLFLFSNFQYIIIAIVLSVGPPYREPLSNNIGFLIDIIFSGFVSVKLLFISATSWIGNIFHFTRLPNSFKLLLLVWIGLNFVVQLYLPARFKYLFKKKVSSKRYKNIEREQRQAPIV